AGADVVLTMVLDADAVLDVVRRARPARGTLWLQSSTVGVDGARRTAELADELGLVLVDAPVLGTKQPAEQGALVVLASGPEDVRLIREALQQSGVDDRLDAAVLATMDAAAERLDDPGANDVSAIVEGLTRS